MLSARHQGPKPLGASLDGAILKSCSYQLHNRNAPICLENGMHRTDATHGRLSRLRHGARPSTLSLASLHRQSISPQGRECDPWVIRHTRAPAAVIGAAAAATPRLLAQSSSAGSRRLVQISANAAGSTSGQYSSNSASDSSSSNSSSSSSTVLNGSAATASAAVAASVAAAVVAGAVASATPPPPPRATALGLLRRVVSLLRSNFLVVLLLYAVKDGAAFLLHRVTQRLTNHAAEVLLGTPISTSPGNPWWLYLDPAFIRAHPGYELLIGFFFLASLPLVIALNSVAFTLAALICAPGQAGERERAVTDADGATAAAAAAPAAAAAAPPPAGGPARGVGAALRLPQDDPAAAALADLGIHALPTAPPRPPPQSPKSPSLSAAGSGATAAPSPPPPLEEPPPSVSAIAAASSLSAAAPPPPSADATGTMNGEASGGGGGGGGGPWTALQSAAAAVGAVLPEAARALRRVWWVDLQFNLRALPLQGLCLLVLPAIWALPRLMRIQLALPAAVLEGHSGTDALARSSTLMTSSLSAYGMPFAALLATSRLLDYAQGVLLVLIPPRWWREVVEVPLLISGAFLLLKAAVRRLQDLLPLAAYLELRNQEAEAVRKQQQEAVLLAPQSDPQAQQQAQLQQLQAQQQQQQEQQEHGANGSTMGTRAPAAVEGKAAGETAPPGAAAAGAAV
ncbi:hypothetical protein PLESTB_001368200 [Pleodorina starrii]|uniref:Uncharacterized protein n=1 Tax=Pleodorina starrii TaxID=330485 RepID=A0A9W6BU95_9CHLO|nr:hypothetical protein PLESTM_000416900 [Pleodorina starrii]GLC58504.1 hypothetical protein PLESTB_001368200 [Pleodorina starrii]GLC74157.1 hypothetical protein PLESTF_001468100 [Pleodorina starrii]